MSEFKCIEVGKETKHSSVSNKFRRTNQGEILCLAYRTVILIEIQGKKLTVIKVCVSNLFEAGELLSIHSFLFCFNT